MVKKILLYSLAGTVLILIAFVWRLNSYQNSMQPQYAEGPVGLSFEIERIGDGPIIFTDMDSVLMKEAETYGYKNANGPSLIRVPDWVESPLGKYYLYFAHHKGEFLRLAYADSLEGPWKMHNEPIIPLKDSGFPLDESPPASTSESLQILKKYTSLSEFAAISTVGAKAAEARKARADAGMKTSSTTRPHVASPEAYIDHEKQQIRLYFHGLQEGNIQMSKVALSEDGIHFDVNPEIIGLPYMRVFKHQNQFFALGMPGILYRSQDGLTGFEARRRWLFDVEVRHSALLKSGNDLYIFYSRVGDKPERILVSKVDISSNDWEEWNATQSEEVLRPERPWEGVNEALEASMRGEIGVSVNQLRDPFVFQDVDGKYYLLYTGAGEQAIGIARMQLK